MRSPIRLALALLWIGSDLAAQGEAPVVTTLADAVRRATTVGPAAQMAVGRRNELVGRARTDAQRPNPIVELRRENEGAPIPYDDFAQVTLPVGLTGRRLALQSALSATRTQATADSLETLRAAGFDAARAWWTAWATASEAQIAMAQAELIDRMAALDSVRAAEGELAEATALRMRLEAQQTTHAAAQAQAHAAQARGRLAALIAESDPRRITLAEAAAPLTPLLEVDSALTLAMAGRLDLAMARAAVAIAEGRRSAERRAVLPDVGLVGGYKGTAGFETSLFGVTLTAPLLNTNAGNRERTAGEWLRAEADRRATELRVTTEVHAALEAARAIDAGTRAFDARFVARADLVAAAAQAAYQEGAASLVELVDAFRAASDARTAQVRGKRARAHARRGLPGGQRAGPPGGPGVGAPGAPEATPTAEVVADTAFLGAEAVAIAQFGLAPVEMTPWRDAWHVPAHIALDPAATQPMGSIVEGRVLAIRVFPGDRVTAGQILAEIHSHEVMDARQQLAAARASATSADSAAAVATAATGRADRLLAARAISTAEAERVRAAGVAARAAQTASQAALERAVALVDHLVGSGTPAGVDEHAALIRAPFDGVITGRSAQPGQVVLVGQPLVTIAREGRLGVLLHLPEEAVASVTVGVPVTLSVPAYPDRTFSARVQRIAPVVDSLSRSIQVWAAIEGAGQSLLRAEMTSDAQLLGGRGDRTLTVPAAALQVMEGDTVVVRVSTVGDGLLLEARPVRPGRRTSAQVEILSGVVVGDTVLSTGAALGKAEILKRRSAEGGGH